MKVKKKNQRKQLHHPKRLPLLKRRLLRRRLHPRSVLRKRFLVFFFESYIHGSYTLQDVDESGEDFADEIDDIPADEDELSEPETKKRKVCPAPQTWLSTNFSSPTGEQKPSFKTAATKPASKKAKPASSRAKKAKPTDVGEED
jgi:hypothetical protein